LASHATAKGWYRRGLDLIPDRLPPKDKTLASSGILHDYPRAGFTPPVTTVDGIDTVDT